jgi:ParB family chromosome partitioning protein
MNIELKMILIDKIQPNPFQPRETFEKESIRELANSLEDANIIQPIVVRKMGDIYQIVAGERRWRAAKVAELKEIPCIVKDIAENRVLLESLIENLHRKDLTDIERENAIHEIWENRENIEIKHKTELAKTLGLYEGRVDEDLEAWEARHVTGMPVTVSTRTIARTRGLETEVRKRIAEKVEEGSLKATEVDIVAKLMRKAPEPIRQELLKPKSHVTPKMAETIVEQLPDEEAQNVVLEEINRERLTEDEVTARVLEIQRTKGTGESLAKEMEVHEGVTYTVGEYECPHCKKHYLIKCDGKKDWVE